MIKKEKKKARGNGEAEIRKASVMKLGARPKIIT